jgi:hypothetical protein
VWFAQRLGEACGLFVEPPENVLACSPSMRRPGSISTRGTAEVKAWLEQHPRWSLQFTPTHASWLNQDRDLLLDPLPATAQARHPHLRGGPRPQMLAYIETYNQTAKPFKWTYTGKVLEG